MKAQLINYFDVWGNKTDGWEVNNLCNEGEIELPETFTDKDILKSLKAVNFLKKTVRGNQLIIENLWPFYEISQKKDFCPICRIEVEESI